MERQNKSNNALNFNVSKNKAVVIINITTKSVNNRCIYHTDCLLNKNIRLMQKISP